ncbi:ATP-binding protein [Acetobacter tropicalis]|nr:MULTISPECIES: ATP-binding protein [Acetobacter]MCC6105753.1 sensor N-terminal transmembrane domain-containing protein [Acetobacter sp.]MCG4254728.1 sensor N-terminal transmembrane domain-containing protein [Acetobacter senegalensis]MCG4257321.1 sensor N-terminal transmembrane domain-containing protein [Acetobacter senegalensis]MCG4262062.1 sensor N-terminal transmembrane domain-containing protein [Acetobacter senegalensis]MCG4267477.1 sensor N-terminal transmembrane domain-containing protei
MSVSSSLSRLKSLKLPGQGNKQGGIEATAAYEASKTRLVSPLMRRIMLVNILPLALLAVTMLFLNQFRNSLLTTEVAGLREQARIYAGALGESAVRNTRARSTGSDGEFSLESSQARRLLLRLTEPSPSAHARLFGPDGQLVADNLADQPDHPPHSFPFRHGYRPPPPGGVNDPSGPPPFGPSFFERLLTWVWRSNETNIVRLDTNEADIPADPARPPEANGPNFRPPPEAPPYIRRTANGRLIITVAEPVIRDGHTVGIIQLTRAASQVDRSVFAVRSSILSLFLTVLVITILLSWYLSLTIARPLLRLAASAQIMRESSGRTGTVPARLLARRDEIGDVARALQASAQALWKRMDAIERFAADVSHEIKNPLSSIRSAIETLLRIEDLNQQRRLLTIINEDVRRLDRLITDISDASRLDAEMSRAQAEPVSIKPLLSVLAEIHQATRKEGQPIITTKVEGDSPEHPLRALAVEDRLVQVLRNLIGNAISFSPPNGHILLEAAPAGNMISISVSDEGPGIPQAKLDSIFDRFYSERPKNENFGQHSGLGLSISRQIVEALHGTIAVENRHDAQGNVAGARFTVRLPKVTT